MTNDDRAALQRLLERLRREQQRERMNDWLPDWRLADLAREADLLVPVIERILEEKP